MARLPQPGGDNGNWGTILNEYLSQSLKPDGTIKDDAITAANIVDSSISEVLFTSAVQAKLNDTPTWNTIANKPAVIAAGTNAVAARMAINATDSTTVQATIAAWAAADAYIDFTIKPDGDPPSVLDSGQSVSYVLGDSSGWKPQMSGGKLIHGTLPASGPYADYYQAQLDGDCRSFGTRFTVNSSDGTTAGILCIAAWADTFQGSGSTVPKTPGHITIDTVANSWAWYVSDGGGTGSTHLKAVKTGTFTPPATDGVAVWEVGAYIDAEAGIAYLYLPGNDAVTGTRYVTVTDGDIATLLTALSLPVTTFAATLAGADVLMVEHYANSAANTARYPRMLNMWGETLRLPRDRSRAIRQKATSVAQPTYKRYFPATLASVSCTTSQTNVDATNALITATAGPTGKILFEADCYYEFSGADTIFMRFLGTGTFSGLTTTAEAVKIGVSGEKARFHIVAEKTGLTPGATGNWTLAHFCLNTAATMKIGGAGGSQVPGLYIKATPL